MIACVEKEWQILNEMGELLCNVSEQQFYNLVNGYLGEIVGYKQLRLLTPQEIAGRLKESSKITKLCDDNFMSIFSFLDLPDLVRVRHTCKNWFRLTDSTVMWRRREFEISNYYRSTKKASFATEDTINDTTSSSNNNFNHSDSSILIMLVQLFSTVNSSSNLARFYSHNSSSNSSNNSVSNTNPLDEFLSSRRRHSELQYRKQKISQLLLDMVTIFKFPLEQILLGLLFIGKNKTWKYMFVFFAVCMVCLDSGGALILIKMLFLAILLALVREIFKKPEKIICSF